MGLFSRNKKEPVQPEQTGQMSDAQKLLQEFKSFGSWGNSSTFNDMKNTLEKLTEETNLEKREALNEKFGKYCQKYLDTREVTASESRKQKLNLVEKALGYQRFERCQIAHDQIKAMDNLEVDMESAMKITSCSRKFLDAYKAYRDYPNKTAINIDDRNSMQQKHEEHLETNIDGIRSKPKLDEAIRQHKRWEELSFPVPLIEETKDTKKLGGALSTRSIITVNNQKGLFSEYSENTLSELTQNCISALPPGKIQSALGNHFEDVVKLCKELSYIRAVDGKEKLLVDAKTKTYEFMTEKLNQTDPAKRRDYEDLAEVIETPEFESVLVGLTERARAQAGIRSGAVDRNVPDYQDGKMDKRSELTSRLAEALGLGDIVAHSERVRMVRNGKVVEGNFIAFAEGYDVSSSDPNVRKTLNEAVLDDLGFLRDTNRIEVFDYLCGQTDRHDGNMIYTLGEPDADGKRHFKGLVGIDNDGSFPNYNGADELEDKEKRDPDKVKSYNRIIRYMPAVDKELADKISKLDRKQLEFYLGDVLDKEYIDRTAERLDRMKEHFKTCTLMEKEDWEKKGPMVERLQKAQGGVYAGIKDMQHLAERRNQKFGFSPEKQRAEAEKEAERKQKLMDSKLADYRKAAAGLTPAQKSAPQRLQVNVSDLEKQVFRDIHAKKQKFHQQKQETKQSQLKESAQQTKEKLVRGRAAGK